MLGEESGTALAPVFTCRAVGFLSGTLLVGVVFDTSPRQHVTLAIAAAGLAAGPGVSPPVIARESNKTVTPAVTSTTR